MTLVDTHTTSLYVVKSLALFQLDFVKKWYYSFECVGEFCSEDILAWAFLYGGFFPLLIQLLFFFF